MFVWVAVMVALHGCHADAPGDRRKSRTHLDLALAAIQENRNLEAAEEQAQLALKYDSHYAEAHNVLGLIDFLRATANYEGREWTDCLTGVDAQVLREEYDQHLAAADAHFAKAIEMDARFGEAWSNRGLVATLREDTPTAIQYLNKALENPTRLIDVTLTRSHLGWAYFQADDYVQAAKHLRQALQFRAQDCVATHRLGRVYFARKEWDKALETFEAAQQCGKPSPDNVFYLARTQRMLQRTVASDACDALPRKSCLAAQCLALVQGGNAP